MLILLFLLLSQVSEVPKSEPETYSVRFVDTTPQKKGLKAGSPFLYGGEKFKVLEIKEDGEMILVKWEESSDSQIK